MKNLLHKATAFSLAICMAVTLLFAGGMHAASAEATDFDVMLGRLETLEQLAKEYHDNNRNSDSVDQLVLRYMSSVRYNTLEWNVLAGAMDEKFVSYVAEQSPDTVQLRSIGLLTFPNGEKTDFLHMIGVMNMVERGSADLGGWMGDTCELVEDIQNGSGTEDELTELAKTFFQIKGSFDREDWVADLDGYNLCKMKSNSETWADCMERYFTPTLTEQQRVGKFVQSNLSSTYTSATVTQSQYRSVVKGKYNTLEIAALRVSIFGSLFEPPTKYHNAACNAVADYLFDTVHAPTPNETNVCIDFANETLEIAAGIAVNSAEDFKGTGYVSGDTILPGTTFYAQGARDVEAGSFIPSEVVTFTAPQRPDAPEAPELTEATVNSLSFASVDGAEYSIDGGETWQSESSFAGLTPHTDYSVICRYRATESDFASEPSKACEVSTLLPEGVYVDDTGIYLANNENVRYMMVAAYQDGQLVSVHAAVKDDNGVWSSPVPDDAGIDSVRVFALGENFLPLIEAYQVVPKPT